MWARSAVAKPLPPGMGLVEPDRKLYESYELQALFDRPELLEPPACLASRLLWAGRQTLLAGFDKQGKSTFMRQAVSAITTGGWFLGERANGGQPGNVLWVSLEEALPDTVQGFKEQGADGRRIVIVTGFLTQDGQRALAQALTERERFVAMIIDTLAAYGSRVGIESERNESEMTRVMQDLLQLARHPAPFGGPAVGIIHHQTRGSKDERGRERGSGAIPANCDVIVNMNTRKMEGDVREMFTRARGGISVPEYALRTTPERRFALTDSTPPVIATVLRQSEQIYTFLQANPNSSAAKIAIELKIRAATIRDILTELEAEGRAKNLGKHDRSASWIAIKPEPPIASGTRPGRESSHHVPHTPLKGGGVVGRDSDGEATPTVGRDPDQLSTDLDDWTV